MNLSTNQRTKLTNEPMNQRTNTNELTHARTRGRSPAQVCEPAATAWLTRTGPGVAAALVEGPGGGGGAAAIKRQRRRWRDELRRRGGGSGRTRRGAAAYERREERRVPQRREQSPELGSRNDATCWSRKLLAMDQLSSSSSSSSPSSLATALLSSNDSWRVDNGSLPVEAAPQGALPRSARRGASKRGLRRRRRRRRGKTRRKKRAAAAAAAAGTTTLSLGAVATARETTTMTTTPPCSFWRPSTKRWRLSCASGPPCQRPR